MNYLEKLLDVLTPPENPIEIGSVNEWNQVSEKIKDLPKDYSDFIKKYGTGSINDFFWVLNPFSKNPYLNLLNRSSVIVDAYLFEPADSLLNNHTFYPSIGGLIPFVITDNGDDIFYRKDKVNQTEKIILINDRNRDMNEFDMGVTEFLFKMCSNQIIQNVFPSGLFDNGCRFEKYKYFKSHS